MEYTFVNMMLLAIFIFVIGIAHYVDKIRKKLDNVERMLNIAYTREETDRLLKR